MLEVRDLSVSYGKHQALEGAAIHIQRGEIVVILGANGAGKSTLLKALSGICEGRVQGSVSLGGQSLDGLGPDRIVEEGIALVPEGRGIFGDLTVEENLKLGAFPDRAKGDEQANFDRVFALFPKLIERRRQIARTMSGGEQQMVAIGRAMMSSPQILMLDEPSLGLSPLLCKELFQNLKAVRELGIGILMVEQNAKQSLAIADRGYLLENTKIVHEDNAQALMTDAAVQAAYLGGGGTAKRPALRQGAAPPETPLSVPAAPVIAPAQLGRASANALVGQDLNALVARAAQAAKETAQSAPVPSLGEASNPLPSTASVQSMLKEFEIAAARAGQARPMPRYEPAKRQPAPASNSQTDHSKQDDRAAEAAPVTIEVYRAPRVEVYRRRPNSAGFERD